MIDKFHQDSQKAMRGQAPNDLAKGYVGMMQISEAVSEALKVMKMKPAERKAYLRNERIASIQDNRYQVKQSPRNHRMIYQLCKAVYELAELDHVNFNGASYMEKIRLINMLIPFADPGSLAQGVLEYHTSRKEQGWEMRYLDQGEIESREAVCYD